jgi:hypothetical protein
VDQDRDTADRFFLDVLDSFHFDVRFICSLSAINGVVVSDTHWVRRDVMSEVGDRQGHVSISPGILELSLNHRGLVVSPLGHQGQRESEQ